ncbi:MAG: glucosaminidase domain-containing protein [Bacteroidales bacterium]
MAKTNIFLFLSILIFNGRLVAQQAEYNAIVASYIQAYKDIAVAEMKEFHIPASITLAQGILESNAGRSPLAAVAKNHFGIKCHKEWTGRTFYQDDETKNECFRKYDNAVESFRDHSMFLTTRDRYKGLFNLKIKDYKGWAFGLKSAGYATNPAYPQLLIKTIETFNLARFDSATGAVPENREEIKPRLDAETQLSWHNYTEVGRAAGNRIIYEINGLRMIIAGSEDNIYLIARDVNVSVGKLIGFNELSRATALEPGQIVFLSKKRRKGSAEHHTVQDGESLYGISQQYGIRLNILCRKNGIGEGVKPRKGMLLRLR